MSYTLYGQRMHDGITLDELMEENATTGMLIARAENSGCEGCYVEVAKWNGATMRWERYAFEKYFGGEHPSERDDEYLSCFATAQRFANDINHAAHPSGEHEALIHSLPDYCEEAACTTAQ